MPKSEFSGFGFIYLFRLAPRDTFLLEDGQSDQYVKDFLVARYGSFVLYNPPVGGSTLWVWLIPVLFAFGASLLAWRVVLQASRRPIDDADEEFFEE